MNYELKKAVLNNKNILYNYKISNILDYNRMSVFEKEKVNNYIINFIIDYINDYKLILVNSKIIGCYCSYIKDNIIFLDEIYIEKEYRNLGIGTCLIKKEIKNAKVKKMNMELWVYKENEKAINLYKRLGFVVANETGTRYLMRLKDN
ncbi:MAG: GNAT family N-acetyltransferase [Bacilli bacterium]|nr:GNAT family N-acetyltransferase [Bacilli bacterium]